MQEKLYFLMSTKALSDVFLRKKPSKVQCRLFLSCLKEMYHFFAIIWNCTFLYLFLMRDCNKAFSVIIMTTFCVPLNSILKKSCLMWLLWDQHFWSHWPNIYRWIVFSNFWNLITTKIITLTVITLSGFRSIKKNTMTLN